MHSTGTTLRPAVECSSKSHHQDRHHGIAQHGLHPYNSHYNAAHVLTIMVNIMAQGSNEQHQLVHSVEALGDLAAHEHHVGGVQHIHHMAEVVVWVLVVVAAHSCDEGHDLALLNLEEVQDAAV